MDLRELLRRLLAGFIHQLGSTLDGFGLQAIPFGEALIAKAHADRRSENERQADKQGGHKQQSLPSIRRTVKTAFLGVGVLCSGLDAMA